MKVGFYLTGAIPMWAPLMVQSVRAAMPGVPIVQFTDETSTPVPTVDVRRVPLAPLSLHRCSHFGNVTGDWLFIDTDVIVQKDVREVFRQSFDVAVTDRKWTLTTNGTVRAGGQPDFAKVYPYNAGVVFSRTPVFWQEMYRAFLTRKDLQVSWYGDQFLLAQLARDERFRVVVLPGMVYNFPPETVDDPDTGRAAIVHYKGPQRKALLADRVRAAA